MRSLLAALIFTFTFLGVANAQPLDNMKDQTVQVIADDGQGSGVLLAPDKVLTASHVVDVSKRVKVNINGAGAWGILGKVTAVDTVLDLAIITLETEQTFTPAKLNCANPTWGEHISIVGFPLGLDWVLTQGYIASTDLVHYGKDGIGYIMLDAFSNHGNSGGPVFNDNGEVVGILLAGFDSKVEGTSVFSPGFMRAANAFCGSELMKGIE